MKDNTILEFQINPIRLNYLLDLYKLTKEDIIKQLQGANKNPVLTIKELDEILQKTKKVNIILLNKLDKIFGKGITWYISDRDLPDREKLSIFFRKDSFNAVLNQGSIKLIEEYEKKQVEIATLCGYIDYKMQKKHRYSITSNAKKATIEIKKEFDLIQEKLHHKKLIKNASNDKDYLENLIRIIEEFNVFIFEFVNKKRKEELSANFSGFFIKPNMIVIKRQQDSIKREIFTLMHEFAHYLLDIEEIDTKVDELSTIEINKVEQWCNDFAYFFLAQNEDNALKELSEATTKNNFHRTIIDELSKKTHLSNLALYTRLKINKQISINNYYIIYDNIMNTLHEEKQKRKEELKLQKEKDAETGKKTFIAQAKPIESRLFKEIVKINYFEGNINQIKVMETLLKKTETEKTSDSENPLKPKQTQLSKSEKDRIIINNIIMQRAVINKNLKEYKDLNEEWSKFIKSNSIYETLTKEELNKKLSRKTKDKKRHKYSSPKKVWIDNPEATPQTLKILIKKQSEKLKTDIEEAVSQVALYEALLNQKNKKQIQNI